MSDCIQMTCNAALDQTNDALDNLFLLFRGTCIKNQTNARFTYFLFLEVLLTTACGENTKFD